MPPLIGVVAEHAPDERRVGLVPDAAQRFAPAVSASSSSPEPARAP